MSQPIETVIFDLGGVLIDWNPEYVFRQVFDTEEEMRYFLEHICTMAWNVQQDAGRSLAEATAWLVQRHPDYADQIRMYYGRWEEMLGGPIAESVALFQQLRDHNQHRLLALTNWSNETFPVALERYDFLQWFEGIVVSGDEKVVKPDPKIYHILLDRYGVEPSSALFIDDNIRNVEGARNVGMQAIHFVDAGDLEKALQRLNISV
jgi:2-haloacid dehalogenase